MFGRIAKPTRIGTRTDTPVVTTSWMQGDGLLEHLDDWVEEHADVALQLYPLAPDWHTFGMCNDLPDVDALFFGVDNLETPALSPSAVKLARSHCDVCPIKRACLTQALTDDERFGIWGGTTGRDRSRMRARIRDGVTVDELVNEWLR